jgi:hypothetical protein
MSMPTDFYLGNFIHINKGYNPFDLLKNVSEKKNLYIM